MSAACRLESSTACKEAGSRWCVRCRRRADWKAVPLAKKQAPGGAFDVGGEFVPLQEQIESMSAESYLQ